MRTQTLKYRLNSNKTSTLNETAKLNRFTAEQYDERIKFRITYQLWKLFNIIP